MFVKHCLIIISARKMSIFRTNQVNLQIVAVTTTITAFTIFFATWYYKRKTPRVPTKWKTVAKVTGLYLYPLKSGKRIHLQKAECTIYGLKEPSQPGKYQLGDRTLIIYKDSTKECRTSKTNPKLILIGVELDAATGSLVLRAPDVEPMKLNVLEMLGRVVRERKMVNVTFLGSETFRVMDCGDEAARWVSKYLTQTDSCDSRMGLYDGTFKRTLSKGLQQWASPYTKLKQNTLGIYSDLTSFLLINEASVADLVQRIPNSNVSANNFRPNILIGDDNLAAFAEDKWDWIKIGEVIFRNVKACTRCSLTTVNPEKGVFNKDFEPLKTLKKYRIDMDLIKTDAEKNDPVMGVHLGLIYGGVINVGDEVSVSLEE